MKAFILSLAFFLCSGVSLAQQTTPVEAPKPVPPKFALALNPFRTIDVNSPKFIQLTAEIAHASVAYGSVETFSRDGHGTFGAAAMGGVAISKEFFYDKKFERQPFKSNLRDAAFYGLGIGLALLQDHYRPIKR